MNYAIAVPMPVACAVAACLIPAWRATMNSALDTLRAESRCVIYFPTAEAVPLRLDR
jgi:hypothetical protein